MKLLVLARKEDTSFCDTYERFRTEIKRQNFETILYGRGYVKDTQKSKNIDDVQEILKSYDYKFDAIYVMDLHDKDGFLSAEPWKNLNKINSSKFILRTDLHNSWDVYRRFIIKCGFKVLFSPYPKEYIENIYGKNLGLPGSINIKLLPHSVDLNIFKPYGEEKIFDVSVLGAGRKSFIERVGIAIKNFPKDKTLLFPIECIKRREFKSLFKINPSSLKDDYPLRSMLHKFLLKQNDIKYFTSSHPKFSVGCDYSRDYLDLSEAPYLVGRNFARAISSSKILFVGSSRWKLPLQKMFQGMACKTCVLTQRPYGERELHFEDGFNYVDVDEKNVIAKIHYYLNHESEREEIARNGFETVVKFHSIPTRVSEFLKELGG